MRRSNFLRYWPVTLILAGLALFAVLAASSMPLRPVAGDPSSALQATIPPSTAPAATLVQPTVIIPDTGEDTIIIQFFSSWVPWAVLGALVIALLVALVARPRGPVGPPDTHHHHHDI